MKSIPASCTSKEKWQTTLAVPMCNQIMKENLGPAYAQMQKWYTRFMVPTFEHIYFWEKKRETKRKTYQNVLDNIFVSKHEDKQSIFLYEIGRRFGGLFYAETAKIT